MIDDEPRYHPDHIDDNENAGPRLAPADAASDFDNALIAMQKALAAERERSRITRYLLDTICVNLKAGKAPVEEIAAAWQTDDYIRSLFAQIGPSPAEAATCEACDGSGVNNHHQLWPGRIACRYCNGTGTETPSPVEARVDGVREAERRLQKLYESAEWCHRKGRSVDPRWLRDEISAIQALASLESTPAQPLKMLVDRDQLRTMIEQSPDDEESDAGVLHPEAPAQPAVIRGVLERGLMQICQEMLDEHHGRQVPLGVDAPSFGMGAASGWDAAVSAFYKRAAALANAADRGQEEKGK